MSFGDIFQFFLQCFFCPLNPLFAGTDRNPPFGRHFLVGQFINSQFLQKLELIRIGNIFIQNIDTDMILRKRNATRLGQQIPLQQLLD